MLDLDHSGSEISQENVHEGLNRKINNTSNDAWHNLLFFLREVQSLQKKIENLNNDTKQCTIYCKDLGDKTLKLVGELDGRKWTAQPQK